MASPGGARFVLRIVLREIIVWNLGIEARFHIAEELAGQGVCIIFWMTGHEGDTLVFAGEQVGIALFRFRQYLQVGVVTYQRRREIGIARVRREKAIVKAAS